MKKIKILILVILNTTLNQKINSQDSLSFHKEFYKTQQNSLLLLSSWSIGNLALSPFLGNNFKVFRNNFVGPVSSNDYFHQMNFDPVLVLGFLQFPFEFFVQNPGLEVESISLIEFVEEIIFEII